ncbi:MAG: winged helix-turn-helix domain-containing protein [Actinomycetia bacterium]|nr:winged helix-turn-helix domain-containing protein [Actinomycetes bacterium]
MHVKILGPIEVASDDETITLGGPKQRAVLAVLATRYGEVVSSDELIDAVWGDDLPANPLNTLQYQIAQLRKLLERDAAQPQHLITRAPGYMLDSATTTLDANRFQTLVDESRASASTPGDAIALKLVDDALALWRGPALVDFRYEDFATSESVRLDDLRLAAEELRVDISLASGQHSALIARLAQLTIDNPLREGLWTRLMLALYRDGQQTEALRAYRRATEVLADVGVEPSQPLRTLEQQIIEQDPALDPPQQQTPTPDHNIPVPPNSLIGRATAVEDLVERLEDGRLITLTGPGGSGKTRLAIEVATRSLGRFPGGVWFVPLDEIDEPTLLAAFTGETIGIRERASRDVIDNLTSSLGDQPSLLVLDNAEHILDAVADLVGKLMARATSLRVMATSQAPLGLKGEIVFGVDPLTLPGSSASIYDRFEDVDAVALFVDRARASGTSVEDWDASAYAAVANIVAALDGMPLAIELAAARTRAMSLAEIADGLQNRFELLSGGPRDAPPRQRTLMGTMEWSMSLLTPKQRSIAQTMSVCTGDFDAATAASMTGIPITELRHELGVLVERSLITRTPDVAGTARYTMIETVRHYGIQSMSEDDAMAARVAHMKTFAAFTTAAGVGICGPEQIMWLERFDAEYTNIRTALAWALESHHIETGLQFGANLGRYWDWKGLLKEASEWMMRLTDAARSPTPSLVSVQAWRAFLAWEFGDIELARSLSGEAQATAATLQDPLAEANALSARILFTRSSGDLDGATQIAKEAITRLDDVDEKWMAAWSVSALTTIAIADGDPTSAFSYATETIARFGDLGDERCVGWGHTALAQISLMQGDLDDARTNARIALAASSRTRDDRNMSLLLELLAEIAHEEGAYERSATLWGAARPLIENRGLTRSISHQDEPFDLEASLRDRLDTSYDALFEEGHADPRSVIDSELDRLEFPVSEASR